MPVSALEPVLVELQEHELDEAIAEVLERRTPFGHWPRPRDRELYEQFVQARAQHVNDNREETQ